MYRSAASDKPSGTSMSPVSEARRPAPGTSYGRARRLSLADQLQRNVDQHVLLPADVSVLRHALEDVMDGYAVTLSRVLGVEQEAGIDTGVSLHDRGPVGPRQPGQERLHDLVGGGQRGMHVHAGLDAQPVERRGQHLGWGVPGAGAEPA